MGRLDGEPSVYICCMYLTLHLTLCLLHCPSTQVDVSGPGGVSGTYYFEDWLKAGPVNLLFPKVSMGGGVEPWPGGPGGRNCRE
jgi:hypothetical protein